tara:strand:- start:77 stop:550 length:474 start_codon:yes stop_codon:yes gene_type:complete
MPGKSKKGGGLTSSPVYKKQKFGEAKSPFMMKGYTYPGTSPLKDTELKVVRNENDESEIIRPKAHGKLTKKIEHKRPQAHGKLTKKIHIDHPVKPPTKPRKDTLKGKTGFEYDMIPVTNVLKKGLHAAKSVYVDPVVKTVKKVKKVSKKVKKYFTER